MPEQPAMDQWYCIENLHDVPQGETANRLLSTDLTVSRDGDAVSVSAAGRTLPVRQRYGYVWTTLGTPVGDVFDIPEAEEDDRRHVPCGAIGVKAAAPRVIENFLDMAHFPFVHTDILGSEPHTEVEHYDCEFRRDVDEVWATNCVFVQPKAALGAQGAIRTDYQYRIATPFNSVLYKTCPMDDARWDVICLFVQPVEPDSSRAHPLMYLIDDSAEISDLIAFQQVIFLQDRIILENQRPRLLPLEPRSETPTRADASSIAYRRWLKEKGVTYGTTLGAA